MKTCDLCDGVGREVGTKDVECPKCHGNGFTGERKVEKEEVEETEEVKVEKKADEKKKK